MAELMNCKAGCTIEVVADALGLRLADLHPRDTQGRPVSSLQYDNLQRAVDAHAMLIGGESAKVYRYAYADGGEAFAMTRYHTAKGKEFFPFQQDRAGRWVLGAPRSNRPLYRLREVVGAVRVVVVEGEKCADLARDLGSGRHDLRVRCHRPQSHRLVAAGGQGSPHRAGLRQAGDRLRPTGRRIAGQPEPRAPRSSSSTCPAWRRARTSSNGSGNGPPARRGTRSARRSRPSSRRRRGRPNPTNARPSNSEPSPGSARCSPGWGRSHKKSKGGPKRQG